MWRKLWPKAISTSCHPSSVLWGRESGPRLIHDFLDPHDSQTPNGISIGSAVLHSSLVCPTQTHRLCTLRCCATSDICSNRPHRYTACGLTGLQDKKAVYSLVYSFIKDLSLSKLACEVDCDFVSFIDGSPGNLTALLLRPREPLQSIVICDECVS